MSAMVTASTPGAPYVRARTSNHARRRTSLRRTRSYRAWNLLFGDRLAAQYSLRCRSRVLSRVLLGLTAMHRLLPGSSSTDEAGALRIGPGCVVLDPRSLLSPPPTPTRLDATSRSTVIRTGCSRAAGPGPGRASPVPVTTFRTFHVPYAGGFFGVALPGSSRLPWPSPCYSRLGSLLSPCGAGVSNAADFASCCGPHGCFLQ